MSTKYIDLQKSNSDSLRKLENIEDTDEGESRKRRRRRDDDDEESEMESKLLNDEER